MLYLKYGMLFLLFLLSSYIGMLYSKKYTNRVKDLREMKNALHMLKTKIQFTYEPIPSLFKEMSQKLNRPVSTIFQKAYQEMATKNLEQAWQSALETVNTNLKQEDITILKDLGRMLGKTDIEGQMSSIEITQNFIETQIKIAEEESKKNGKLYKNLGITIGLAMILILI